MSRFVKGANASIFQLLDNFCATRGVLLSNAGAPRWIASQNKHRYAMRMSVIRTRVALSTVRKLARIELGPKIFICTVGFDNPNPIVGAVEIAVDAAFLTIVLAELAPRPRATPSEIRNIVEAGDLNSDNTYNGHDPDLIAGLFPTIRVFETPALAEEEAWKSFFGVCVDECEFSESWIESDLARTLKLMREFDPNKIPYPILCRSIFDTDPTSFFLALYRCLEALYAFAGARRLMDSLGMSMPWANVAVALETELGWYPREENSLTQLLGMAAIQDLQSINALLSDAGTDGEVDNVTNRAARRIYRLRNSIVHYRPAHSAMVFDCIDWNKTCDRMANIVVYVYSEVFES
jgi:hypothetical protein